MPDTTTTIWAERYPHPGKAPEKGPPPADEEINGRNFSEWYLARHVWNEYVLGLRRHEIARSIDQLGRHGDPLNAEQRIAMTIGVAILDGTFAQLAGIPKPRI